jgi:hypothetical protein
MPAFQGRGVQGMTFSDAAFQGRGFQGRSVSGPRRFEGWRNQARRFRAFRAMAFPETFSGRGVSGRFRAQRFQGPDVFKGLAVYISRAWRFRAGALTFQDVPVA